MSIPHIDTFENDIADEIKRKEASLGDIASAGGDVGNKPVNKMSGVTVIIISLLLIILAGILVFTGYSYYQMKINPPQPLIPIETPVGEDATLLPAISGEIADGIGRFVVNVEKSDVGYTVMINNYSPVFSFMFKNENTYADELANNLGAGRDMSTTTPPFEFTDVTLNNQNMRVGTSGSSTITYAFVNSRYLLIATSTEAILILRSAIIQ